MKSRPSLRSALLVSCMAISPSSGASSFSLSCRRPASFAFLQKSYSTASHRSSLRTVGTNNHDCTADTDVIYQRRRDVIRRIPLVLLPLTAAAILFPPSEAYAASSDLFKPNPLTNPVLEKLRIWNQDEADNLQYNGELTSGSTRPAPFVRLLQPILAVERDISALNQILHNTAPAAADRDDMATLEAMDRILSQPNLQTLNFKKAFNSFADNIYYSDPDRANLYLGGGATPGATQSLAYLLRNEVLTDVEDMRAEVRYWRKEMEGGKRVEVEWNDLCGFANTAKEGMERYLDLVPPKELEAARALFDGGG